MRIIYKMFTLVTAKSKYFRIKRGQSADEVESRLCIPVGGDAFCGRIIESKDKFDFYIAKPGDSYRSVAEKSGVAEAELREINGNKIVYPTVKLFVPCRRA